MLEIAFVLIDLNKLMLIDFLINSMIEKFKWPRAYRLKKCWNHL